ncbi:hypothetical protein LZC95_16035 [Pendulispora brunnea]|uniref:Uncharacterized protein n=1 Tax=Pendulispora brunnea TaxID=2905690 RepID=A0ABZ2KIF1_9BACT
MRAALCSIVLGAIAVVGTSLGACLMTIDENRIPGSVADAASRVSLACGDGACTLARAVCCARNFGDTDYRNGYCTVVNQCESGDYFTCQRTRDCREAGTVCCTVMDRGSFTHTECAASCKGSMLCEPGVDRCPDGKMCTPSQGFPGLGECI